jgi:MFS family permease
VPEPHDPYAALRHADYRRLLSGSVLAAVGSEMLNTAIGWELKQRTDGSALALGVVGLVQFLPVLLLALPAGHVADRYSRKWLLVASQVGMALAAMGLAALSYFKGPIPLIYVCLLVAGVARAFGMPARWALLPQVVPANTLANAVTWNSTGWQIASTAGPALGGLVLAVSGWYVGAYLLAALLVLACATLVAFIRSPRPTARLREPISLASLLTGIRFVWKTELILATITLDLFAVLVGGVTALLPIFAEDILGTNVVGFGFLRTAPSVGALLMALFLAHRPPLRRAGRALLWAVAGFGAAIIAFGLSRNLALSLVLLAVTGALDNISVVIRGTLVQTLTPDELRGRVAAVNAIFIDSSNRLGDFESGLTAHYFGPVASAVAGGIGTLLVVLVVILKWPALLRLGPLHTAGQEQKPKEGAVAEEAQSPPPS